METGKIRTHFKHEGGSTMAKAPTRKRPAKRPTRNPARTNPGPSPTPAPVVQPPAKPTLRFQDITGNVANKGTSIDVSPDANVVTYRLLRRPAGSTDPNAVVEVGGGTNPHFYDRPTPGVAYEYRVQVLNNAGATDSDWVAHTYPVQAPPAPTPAPAPGPGPQPGPTPAPAPQNQNQPPAKPMKPNVTVVDQGQRQGIGINGTRQADALMYRCERLEQGTQNTLFVGQEGPNPFFLDDTAALGAMYQYRIYAVNQARQSRSDWSDPVRRPGPNQQPPAPAQQPPRRSFGQWLRSLNLGWLVTVLIVLLLLAGWKWGPRVVGWLNAKWNTSAALVEVNKKSEEKSKDPTPDHGADASTASASAKGSAAPATGPTTRSSASTDASASGSAKGFDGTPKGDAGKAEPDKGKSEPKGKDDPAVKKSALRGDDSSEPANNEYHEVNFSQYGYRFTQFVGKVPTASRDVAKVEVARIEDVRLRPIELKLDGKSYSVDMGDYELGDDNSVVIPTAHGLARLPLRETAAMKFYARAVKGWARITLQVAPGSAASAPVTSSNLPFTIQPLDKNGNPIPLPSDPASEKAKGESPPKDHKSDGADTPKAPAAATGTSPAEGSPRPGGDVVAKIDPALTEAISKLADGQLKLGDKVERLTDKVSHDTDRKIVVEMPRPEPPVVVASGVVTDIVSVDGLTTEEVNDPSGKGDATIIYFQKSETKPVERFLLAPGSRVKRYISARGEDIIEFTDTTGAKHGPFVVVKFAPRIQRVRELELVVGKIPRAPEIRGAVRKLN
jgi:hypothetical protein